MKELAVQANGTKVKYVHSIDQTNDSTLWISTVGEGIVKVTLENQRKESYCEACYTDFGE